MSGPSRAKLELQVQLELLATVIALLPLSSSTTGCKPWPSTSGTEGQPNHVYIPPQSVPRPEESRREQW